MKDMQEERASFVNEITFEVAKMIAQASKVSLKEAKNEFNFGRRG